MDAITAILTRTSAAELGEPGPNAEQLKTILTAAAAAPDHGRLKPWRLLVMEGEARFRLGDAMAAMRKAEAPEASEAELQRERDKVKRAPTIVAVVAHVDPAHKIPVIEQMIAVGAATENMFLTAHALGLGAMWKTGPAAYSMIVKQALGLDEVDSIIAFLYLGSLVGTPELRDYEPGIIARYL